MATKSLTKVNLNSPQSLANFATELKTYIVKNKLFMNISGKNYVLVEGWQFAGGSIGVYPVVASVERIETEDKNEIKYMAKVELVRADARNKQVIGAAFAVCSSKESKRRNADEYVIASMAQTRAVGKAYRNMIGWLMKLAGYESTPAEEADSIEAEPAEPEAPQVPIEEIRAKVNAHIMTLNPTDKIKFIKIVNKVSDKKLTDSDYTRLYWSLEDEKSNG